MSELSLVRVQMGGRPCAIPCERIVEVVPRVKLSSVPDSGSEVVGVINLRGRVVPVMDVRARLSGSTGPLRTYRQLVILDAGEKQIGLAVDDVLDVREVPRDSIEKPGNVVGMSSPGVVRIDDELVLVVEPENVIHGGS